MSLAKLSNKWFPVFPSFFDNFFEGDVLDWSNSNFAGVNSTLPAVNLAENNDEYEIEVAAPGLKKEDFKLNYENGQLIISSEHKEENEVKDGKKVTRKEFSYQSFQRSFTVPESAVNTEGITAKYEDGILHVRLPKKEEVKPKPAKMIEIM